MAKINRHKNEHPNFLHLGEVLHHMEHGIVAAYDWLCGPAMSEKERNQHKMQEDVAMRYTIGF